MQRPRATTRATNAAAGGTTRTDPGLPAAATGEATGAGRFESGLAGERLGSGDSTPLTDNGTNASSGAGVTFAPASNGARLQLRMGTRRMTPYQMCVLDGGCPGIRAAGAATDSTAARP